MTGAPAAPAPGEARVVFAVRALAAIECWPYENHKNGWRDCITEPLTDGDLCPSCWAKRTLEEAGAALAPPAASTRDAGDGVRSFVENIASQHTLAERTVKWEAENDGPYDGGDDIEDVYDRVILDARAALASSPAEPKAGDAATLVKLVLGLGDITRFYAGIEEGGLTLVSDELLREIQQAQEYARRIATPAEPKAHGGGDATCGFCGGTREHPHTIEGSVGGRSYSDPCKLSFHDTPERRAAKEAKVRELAERLRAPRAASPKPGGEEATRPTHVRILACESGVFRVGRVYPVLRWLGNGEPVLGDGAGSESWVNAATRWEPTTRDESGGAR